MPGFIIKFIINILRYATTEISIRAEHKGKNKRLFQGLVSAKSKQFHRIKALLEKKGAIFQPLATCCTCCRYESLCY